MRKFYFGHGQMKQNIVISLGRRKGSSSERCFIARLVDELRLTWWVAARWLMGCERETTWMPISWRMSGDRLAAMERAGLIRGDGEASPRRIANEK